MSKVKKQREKKHKQDPRKKRGRVNPKSKEGRLRLITFISSMKRNSSWSCRGIKKNYCSWGGNDDGKHDFETCYFFG